MVTFTRAAWLLVPVATTLFVGCEGSGGSSGTSGAATTTAVAAEKLEKAAASAAVSAAATRAARGTTARSGLVGLFIGAARESGALDAQQKEIDKVEQSLGAPPREEQKELLTDVMTAVKAGSLDPAKLAPRIEAVEKAMAARREKEVAALVALHTALTPSQRLTVTAALRAKMAGRFDHAGDKPGDKGADKPGDKGADKPGDKGADKGDHGKGPGGADFAKRRLERMTTELELDAGQQKKVEALLAAAKGEESAREELKKRLEALMTAFEAEVLDATKIDLGPAGKLAREATEKHLAFLSGLVPVLDAKQREKLAASMARGPRGFGGPSDGDPGFGRMMFGDDGDRGHHGPGDAPPPDAKGAPAAPDAKDAKPAK